MVKAEAEPAAIATITAENFIVVQIFEDFTELVDFMMHHCWQDFEEEKKGLIEWEGEPILFVLTHIRTK